MRRPPDAGRMLQRNGTTNKGRRTDQPGSRRVDMPGINSGPSYLQATTKDQVFKRIKHERAVELAAEGHSFNDMKRWGLLETLAGEVKGFTGRFYYNRVVRDRDYLWPIPLDEMDRNPNMTQNPGWS